MRKNLPDRQKALGTEAGTIYAPKSPTRNPVLSGMMFNRVCVSALSVPSCGLPLMAMSIYHVSGALPATRRSFMSVVTCSGSCISVAYPRGMRRIKQPTPPDEERHWSSAWLIIAPAAKPTPVDGSTWK